jgi:hypothetical protein
MSSRNMCLLPRATLHSDSEQVQSLQRTLKALRRKGIMSSSYNDTKKLFQGRKGPIAIDKGTPAVRYETLLYEFGIFLGTRHAAFSSEIFHIIYTVNFLLPQLSFVILMFHDFS